MRTRHIGLLLIPLLLLVAACSGGSDEEASSSAGRPSSEARAIAADEEEAAILDAVLMNLRGLEKEDLDLAMMPIDPDSRIYDTTKNLTREFFKMYDIDYEISDLVVTSKTSSEASVHFVQVTRKVSGPDFRDNRIEGEHLLHKKDGKWLVYQTRPDKVDYLN
jgi:hypothetical protein